MDVCCITGHKWLAAAPIRDAVGGRRGAHAPLPSHANFARRANLSRCATIDLTPKSVASFRLSRSEKRGGSRSSRTLGAGCDGRGTSSDE